MAMPQEGGNVQMVADAVDLQTNFDSEAGFNMNAELKDGVQTAACKGQGR